MCAYHCAPTSCTTQHRTVLIIFPLLLKFNHHGSDDVYRTGGRKQTQKIPHSFFDHRLLRKEHHSHYVTSLQMCMGQKTTGLHGEARNQPQSSPAWQTMMSHMTLALLSVMSVLGKFHNWMSITTFYQLQCLLALHYIAESCKTVQS